MQLALGCGASATLCEGIENLLLRLGFRGHGAGNLRHLQHLQLL